MRSIRKKFYIYFVLVIVSFLLLSNLIFYYIFSDIYKDRLISYQKTIIEQNCELVNNLMNNINHIAFLVSNDASIADALNEDIKNSLDKISKINTIEEIFKSYRLILNDKVNTQWEMYLLIDENFDIVKGLPGYSEENVKNTSRSVFSTKGLKYENWVEKTKSLEQSLNGFYFENDTSTLCLSKWVDNPKIINPKDTNHIGISLIKLNTSYFERIFNYPGMVENTNIFLFNQDNKIIFKNHTSDNVDIKIQEELGYKLNNYEVFMDESYMYGKEQNILSIYPLDCGFTMVTMVPKKGALENLAQLKVVVILLTIISGIVGAMVSKTLSKQITKPITQLASKMKDIVVGEDFNTQIEVNKKLSSELTILYHSFNSLLQKIRDLLEKVYNTTQEKKDAELKALQAQINPHFIYNTLDAISWLAIIEKNITISEMSNDLAEVLRYSIKNPIKHVPIKCEIEIINNYIGIQSKRFNQEIFVKVISNCDLDKVLIPKFILQPLVENSLIHGLQQDQNNGYIHIKVMEKTEEYIIQVVDNGKGAACDRLNDYLSGNKIDLKDSDGFGIKNVNQRIQMFYGEEYGLRFKNGKNGGTIAEIIIPNDRV